MPRCPSNFLVNSADRVIRVFDIDVIMASYEDEEPEALQRLQDLVNRSLVSFLYITYSLLVCSSLSVVYTSVSVCMIYYTAN
jgi:hypothetical protein